VVPAGVAKATRGHPGIAFRRHGAPVGAVAFTKCAAFDIIYRQRGDGVGKRIQLIFMIFVAAVYARLLHLGKYFSVAFRKTNVYLMLVQRHGAKLLICVAGLYERR